MVDNISPAEGPAASPTKEAPKKRRKTRNYRPFALQRFPKPPRSPKTPPPTPRWMRPDDDAPKASFVECHLFPANRPLGFPHLIDTSTFTEDTDLRSFRMCDVVATIFYKYNHRFCKVFFDEAYGDIDFSLNDKRIHCEGMPTWTVTKTGNAIRVYFTPGDYRSLEYCAEIEAAGSWDPVEISDVGDAECRSLEDETMELYGSYIGRKILCPEPFRRTPYFGYEIVVDGAMEHPEWPNKNHGPSYRKRSVGLIYEHQPANLGLVRQLVVWNSKKIQTTDGPKNREHWGPEHGYYSLE
ncbi:hypothetical protein QBC34DRAFT_469699 [Podospora aff. communis PSN243]|uniref:Uncharacterized protein n=1 Tax=Podospora aff. communis PSN243 TaxID=3040156 RepID=A0AAV9GG50_9PEZI|nr:hypothetical protein QBC34DRAFT_469699 [Podospora aff. communis PSN243]